MATLIGPEHMLLLGVDIKGYGTSPAQGHHGIQADLVALMDDASRSAGVDRGAWLRQRKGDEELSAIPTPEDGIRIIDSLLRHLVATLFRLNDGRRDESRMRLRVAVHEGWVSPAANGWGGRAVVDVSRLLNSSPLREALAEHSQRDLAVLISRTLYHQVVLGGLTSFRPSDFTRVVVREKEFTDEAWLWCPPDSSTHGRANESAIFENLSGDVVKQPGNGQHAETKDSSAAVQAGRDATVIDGNGNTVVKSEVGEVTVQGDVTFGISHVQR